MLRSGGSRTPSMNGDRAEMERPAQVPVASQARRRSSDRSDATPVIRVPPSRSPVRSRDVYNRAPSESYESQSVSSRTSDSNVTDEHESQSSRTPIGKKSMKLSRTDLRRRISSASEHDSDSDRSSESSRRRPQGRRERAEFANDTGVDYDSSTSIDPFLRSANRSGDPYRKRQSYNP